MFRKLDIKTIFIIILAIALILKFIFGGPKEIVTNGDELERIKKENKELIKINEDLMESNEELNIELESISNEIDSLNNSLSDNNNSISDLENEKDQISDRVRVLNADGVAESLTEYLNKRQS